MTVFWGGISCGFVEIYWHFWRNKQSSSSEKHLSDTKTLDICWRDTVRLHVDRGCVTVEFWNGFFKLEK